MGFLPLCYLHIPYDMTGEVITILCCGEALIAPRLVLFRPSGLKFKSMFEKVRDFEVGMNMKWEVCPLSLEVGFVIIFQL